MRPQTERIASQVSGGDGRDVSFQAGYDFLSRTFQHGNALWTSGRTAAKSTLASCSPPLSDSRMRVLSDF
jgi:hypothetical protein